MKKIFIYTLILCVFLLPSCTKKVSKQGEITNHKSGQFEEVEAKTAEVTLYFADSNASKLCAETRKILQSKASDPHAILGELIKGTEDKELVSVIPKTTKINSCIVEDGVCTVDLSRDFVSDRGTANEQMCIYSVVNTLCLIEGVDSIQFLIDGEKLMIFGNYIFDEPFTADDTITE